MPRITIRPILDPAIEIDLTHRLVAAIAEEIWRVCGGNDELNWLEAEQHLATIASRGGVVDAASAANGASVGATEVDEPGAALRFISRTTPTPTRRRAGHVGKRPEDRRVRASSVA